MGRGILLLLIGQDLCQGTVGGIEVVVGGVCCIFFLCLFFCRVELFFFYSDLFVEWNISCFSIRGIFFFFTKNKGSQYFFCYNLIKQTDCT